MKPFVSRRKVLRSTSGLRLSPRVFKYFVVTLWAAASAITQAQSILNVGFPGQISRAWDVSDDGSVVVGGAFLPRPRPFSGTYQQAFAWRRDLSLQYYYPATPYITDTQAIAVSGDGSTAVITEHYDRSYIMRDPVTRIDVGGEAPAISYDGKTVAGWFQDGSGNSQPFRWTEVGGFQPLGLPDGYDEGWAQAMVPDGSIIVGYYARTGQSGSNIGFRWTQANGIQFLLRGAETFLPGGVSDDGQILVGSDGTHAARWTEEAGSVPLPLAGGFRGAGADDISGDGRLVVGSVGNTMPERAILWDGENRPWLLDDLLLQLGIVSDGWILKDATAISRDGRYIVGNGTFDGIESAFLIDLGPGGFSAPIPESDVIGKLAAVALLVATVARRFGLRRTAVARLK